VPPYLALVLSERAPARKQIHVTRLLNLLLLYSMRYDGIFCLRFFIIADLVTTRNRCLRASQRSDRISRIEISSKAFCQAGFLHFFLEGLMLSVSFRL
jgi:hypothetical protein